MEVILLLANAAETGQQGLVSALGLGWSVTSTPTTPTALIVLMKVPWDQTNMKHRFDLELRDADGQLAVVSHDDQGGAVNLQVQGEFEVGRPPGLPRGTAIDNTMVFNMLPMQLNAGTAYQWSVRVDGTERATRSFNVRP